MLNVFSEAMTSFDIVSFIELEVLSEELNKQFVCTRFNIFICHLLFY